MASESQNHNGTDSRHELGGNPSSDSISEVSSYEMDKTIADRFEGHLYHVLPSGMKVIIQFVLPVLFNDFMGLLEKEFNKAACTLEDEFTVTSHILGRKVTIKVYEAKKTIEVSGPGHKLWRDITFKRISSTLFTRFLQNFTADIQSSINTTDVQPQMTSTPMVPRLNTSMPAVPSAETSGLQRTPVERQMTAILESLAYHSKMISTLQEQLTTLTTEVVKLQQQAPGTKVTSKENPPARCRTFSISSVESETSNSQRVNSDQQQSTVIGQTPSLPRSKSKHKNRKDNVNLRNTKTNASQRSQQVPVAKKTLIIGDSIIKGINPRGLKDNIHCIGIPGATVETVHEQIALYDMRNFSTAIIYIGGNNVSNGSNIEYVEEKYDQLLQFIKTTNSALNIILCTVSPRKDCLVTELNEIIKSLSEEHGTKLVEMENYFCDSVGNPVLRYYGKDKIHLSMSGIRRLLDSIEKSVDNLSLVENFEACVFHRRQAKQRDQHTYPRRVDSQNQRQSGNPLSSNQRRATNHSCVKCGESNHATFDCKHKTQIKCHSCGFLGHKQSRCPSL